MQPTTALPDSRPFHAFEGGVATSDDARASVFDLLVTRRAARRLARYVAGPVWLMVDAGPSMQAGPSGSPKSVVAARVAAMLAWSVHEAGDCAGGLVVSPEGLRVFEPSPGRQSILGFLATLSRATSLQGGESAPSAARCLQRVRALASAGGRIFVISDFACPDPTDEARLTDLSRHGDVICVAVSDGPATPSSNLRDLCRRNGMGLVTVGADRDPSAALAAALRRRPDPSVAAEA